MLHYCWWMFRCGKLIYVGRRVAWNKFPFRLPKRPNIYVVRHCQITTKSINRNMLAAILLQSTGSPLLITSCAQTRMASRLIAASLLMNWLCIRAPRCEHESCSCYSLHKARLTLHNGLCRFVRAGANKSRVRVSHATWPPRFVYLRPCETVSIVPLRERFPSRRILRGATGDMFALFAVRRHLSQLSFWRLEQTAWHRCRGSDTDGHGLATTPWPRR